MSESAAAQEAFRRVALIASGHCADLDPAARLMAAHAWVGGGAPGFAAELARRRTALQSALEAALGAIHGLAVRQGRPPLPVTSVTSVPSVPSVPSVRTSVTVMVATPGTFRGVAVPAMEGLVNALGRAAEDLPAVAARLHAELAALCLPGGAAGAVSAVAAWAGEQSLDLRRRLELMRRTVAGLPASDGGTTPSALIGFGLFEAFAADYSGAGSLLRRAAAGDRAALAAVAVLQQQGRDATLAARVHAWWRGLPTAVQEELAEDAPQAIGSLDGLPAAVRDHANRLFLATEKARLTAETARLMACLRRTGRPETALAIDAADRTLRKIAMVEKALAPGGTAGHPPVYLLSFAHSGPGRLVVSWGDPDTADTTVTYVPGLGSRLTGFDGDIERARQLWQQCAATAAGRRVASIAWLGYDAPQLGSALVTPGTSVAMDAAATTGAGALAAFADGLRAAHQPSGAARSVVLGHSYGSLVAGKAAVMRPGRLADDLVFVGSPGVGVEHASELGVGPGHVWVGEAGNDPVAYLGRFAADPGDAAFGARRFFVQRALITEAHSSYWLPQSASLRNLGRIVNGQYDRLVQRKPLDRPQLLMPELAPDLVEELDR
ncbi:alpha/beta hydrolase [Microbispora sp. NPDC049125]|uniref:alpha/beta hydrolase n=1 Tax=Microbispora sp. NPDC049125 TaxID=3154929 RepID=UPI00346535B8